MITKERRLSRFILILMAASGLMAGTAHADELKGMELAEQIAETAEAAVDSAGAVADIMNGGDEDGTGLSQAIYDEYREESLRDQIVAYAMQFVHPMTGQLISVNSPLPADMARLVSQAGWNYIYARLH